MNEKLAYPGSLHCHTDYSNFRLRDSINKVDELIEYANELGHKVIAITEHETVASSVAAYECWEKIKEKNPDFKVILGNEIYLVRDGLTAENYNKDFDRYYHFILLAKDAIGHKQIRELSTRAWMRSYKQGRMIRVPTYYSDLIEIIGKNPGHVIGSTACLGGALPTQLLRWRENKDDIFYEEILRWIDSMVSLFGKGNFFLEMQPSANKDQLFVNNQLLKISEEKDIPYIITTDAHYKSKEMRKIHKAYLNSQDGDREVDDFYATTYLMNTSEIEEYMIESLGEENLQKSYKNIMNIYDMCEMYDLRQPLRIPLLPWRDIPEHLDELYYIHKMPELRNFKESKYKEDNYLVRAVISGIKEHEDLQNDSAYEELNNCLRDTWVSSEKNNARWSAYFLNLQKTIDLCWEAGTIIGPGRGSGVGFLLLYCLDIIQINSLREKTKTFRFRFLNPDRVSVLDVDTDISGLKRAQVLSHLREYYGEDRVANVLTLGTEKSRSAILTAARGLGIDVDIARYLSGMIESDRGEMRTLKQTFYGDEEKGFSPNKQFVFEMTENYPELWEIAQAIEGLICRVG